MLLVVRFLDPVPYSGTQFCIFLFAFVSPLYDSFQLLLAVKEERPSHEALFPVSQFGIQVGYMSLPRLKGIFGILQGLDVGLILA